MGDEFSNIESWTIINSFYSRIFGVYNICANRVGEESFEEKRAISVIEDKEEETRDISLSRTGSKTYKFWGGSQILNPFGLNIATAELYKTDEIFGEVQKEFLRKKRILLPYLRNDDPYFTHRELQRILFEKPYIKVSG